jgi:UDP-GlcNAc3NAcA epimerase
MPEEINRIACDHMSTLLFCPTDQGMQNLTNEGFKSNSSDKASIDHPNVFKTGDIMFDNSLYFASISGNSSSLLESIGMLEKPYVLCTIHRDANTDQPIHLSSIFESLISISETSGWDIVLPLHPRTKNKMKENLDKTLSTKIFSNAKFHLIPPAGFLDMIALESNCQMVITDSGGVQKEAFFFKKPCIILRPQTEWVEIVENGNAILTGADGEKIQQAFHVLSQKTDYSYPAFFGDGKAAEEICSLILQSL